MRLGFAVVSPAALLTCVLLASCGGSTSASTVAAKEGATEQKTETDIADFARCLREHGIDAEAQSGPGPNLKLNLAGVGRQGLEAAEKACARYHPYEAHKGNPPPHAQPGREQSALKFARCMRSQGIELEAVAGGNIRASGSGSSNPESAAFQRAKRICEDRGAGPFS